jgi:hypothetical protein
MARAMICHKCNRIVENVGEEAVKVTCSYCVFSIVGMPESPKSAYKPTGRPAGWHWMAEFVDKDGNVFHRGKEQPKLKGTLSPTKVKPPKKKIKRRSQQEILLAREVEKKVALKKAIKKQKDFLNHKFGE